VADRQYSIVSDAAVSAELPCANLALLTPLKASAEFTTIAPRLAADRPLDAWQEDDLHFFVFQLRPDDGEEMEHEAESESPVAVFVMDSASDAPISAVVVRPSGDGAEVAVHDLRTPGGDSMTPTSPQVD
jgi:hypothetical protein